MKRKLHNPLFPMLRSSLFLGGCMASPVVLAHADGAIHQLVVHSVWPLAGLVVVAWFILRRRKESSS
jgi:hypothetical protein